MTLIYEFSLVYVKKYVIFFALAYSLKASFCIRNASKWVFFNSEVIHCISFFWEAFLAILHIPDFCQVWWYLGPQVPDWIIHTSLKKMFSLFCLLLSSSSLQMFWPDSLKLWWNVHKRLGGIGTWSKSIVFMVKTFAVWWFDLYYSNLSNTGKCIK